MSQLPDALRRALLEPQLRAQFETSLSARVDRTLEIEPARILPVAPFAHVTFECHALYVAGHFFACICVCQVVAEGITKHIYERLALPFQRDHLTRVRHLARSHGLPRDIRRAFVRIHRHRNDYHHLNAQVPLQHSHLAEESRVVYSAFIAVLGGLFAYSIIDGAISPTHPQYWPSSVALGPPAP